MIKSIKWVCLCVCMMMVVGCAVFDSERGYVRDRTVDYKPGGSLPPLKKPPGVESIRSDPYYQIPELHSNKPTNVSLYPPRSAALKNAQTKFKSKTDLKEAEQK